MSCRRADSNDSDTLEFILIALLFPFLRLNPSVGLRAFWIGLTQQAFPAAIPAAPTEKGESIGGF